MPGHLGRKPCSNRCASDSTCTVDAVRHINGYVCMYVCPTNSKTKIKQNTQCNKLSNQSKEKDIECNLRLKISTEREETMASGKEFQVLIIRFEKKFP